MFSNTVHSKHGCKQTFKNRLTIRLRCSQPSQLEHLCINLCAETMQHFYNTHIFKSSIESCRDEGIRCDVEVDYVDNVPCIDLISSLVSTELIQKSINVLAIYLHIFIFFFFIASGRHTSNSRYLFFFFLQRTGLLSMLDVECSMNGSVELYLRNVKSQHRNNPRLFEPKTVDQKSFGIQHFAGKVVYDASNFLGKQFRILRPPYRYLKGIL